MESLDACYQSRKGEIYNVRLMVFKLAPQSPLFCNYLMKIMIFTR